MKVQRRKKTTRPAIPADIYIAQVDSLYQEGRTLLVGYLTVIGSIFLTYWRTGDIALPASAALFTVITILRATGMRAYARARDRIKTSEDAGYWERWYGVGAASALATLGTWCFLTFSRMDDGYAQLVSYSITIAYVIGITGRNFGSGRLVYIQILSVALPMLAALLIFGDIYYRAFAPALAMFFLSVALICERLRRNLLSAVISSREVSQLAQRFDTALTNMPHGLCMFDAEHRIVVANQKINEQIGLPPTLDLRGHNLDDLVSHCVLAGTLSDANGERFAHGLAQGLSGNQTDKFSVEIRDGRTIEITVEPMDERGMVMVVEDVTERKHAEAKINHMARFDALTGLPNRTILQSSLQAAADNIRGGNAFAVHFIDIDQFKQVNDTLGHSRGDVLLQEAADRLRRAVRPTDTVARFGGDEFIVLQARVDGEADASSLADRLLQVLREPYVIEGGQVRASASIGIAIAQNDGADVEQLLRNADMALYCAKAEGRNGWRFFKPEMELAALSRRRLEFDLRRALTDHEFEIHYQPIIDLKTRRVRTCEALLRWAHPERGMIWPAEFIPVAEEMGIVTEIDQWVLREACAQCRQWPDDVHVAVNLSPLQFMRTNVPETVERALAAAHLPPHRLEIEITETILLQDTVRSRNALRELQRMGVGVSLDDFGTKYSGLSYLHSFPLHKVKIDQSFVRNLHEGRMMTLLRGVARMSAELGLRVTVEGIETEEQLALIANEPHIDEVQGYLFGKPMPSSALRAMLFASTTLPVGKVA